MRPFHDRPPEVAALMNPAFCALLLCDAVSGFTAESGGAMPFACVPLVLPLSLHTATRDLLPTTTRTKMHVWLQAHPEVRVSFGERTRQLYPYAREALLFASQRGLLAFTDHGAILRTRKRFARGVSLTGSTDLSTSRKAAAFVGKWLVQAGEVGTVYAMWGIRP